jgi:hypothetical protein
VEGSCEHGNEHSGSIKCWEARQEGLSSMELVNMVGKGGFMGSESGFCYGRNIYLRLGAQLSGRMDSPPVPCTTIMK